MSRDNKTHFYKLPKRNIGVSSTKETNYNLPMAFPQNKNNNISVPNNQSISSNSFFQSIKDGFATSIGFNIADRAVSSIFGNRKVDVVHTNSVTDPCPNIALEYNKLLEKGDVIPDYLKNQYEKCNRIV
jgi:hypothetical protein